jgi:hypothetical protein
VRTTLMQPPLVCLGRRLLVSEGDGVAAIAVNRGGEVFRASLA